MGYKLMLLFKYVTLTLRQQQHPDDAQLLPRGKQSHISKGPIEEDDKSIKEYEYMYDTTEVFYGKT